MAAERRARIAQVVAHRPGLRSLLLDLDGPLAFRPGQFVSLLLPIREGQPPSTRAYSIASLPDTPGPIELCIDLVPNGPGSAYLFGLSVGAELTWTGPWGTFVLDRAPTEETVFVAEATGIAPLRSMLHRAARTTSRPFTLLYAHTDGLFRDELARLPHLTILDTTVAELEPSIRRRWIDGDARRDRHFFICGIGDRVHRLRDILRAAGYARRAVQYERW